MSPAILLVLQCALNRRFAVRQMMNKAQKSIPNSDNIANKQLLFFESLNAFVNTISDSTNKTEKSAGTAVLNNFMFSIFLVFCY